MERGFEIRERETILPPPTDVVYVPVHPAPLLADGQVPATDAAEDSEARDTLEVPRDDWTRANAA